MRWVDNREEVNQTVLKRPWKVIGQQILIIQFNKLRLKQITLKAQTNTFDFTFGNQ